MGGMSRGSLLLLLMLMLRSIGCVKLIHKPFEILDNYIRYFCAIRALCLCKGTKHRVEIQSQGINPMAIFPF